MLSSFRRVPANLLRSFATSKPTTFYVPIPLLTSFLVQGS